jgi:hypothetical protein
VTEHRSTFRYLRTTKNKHVYEEVGQNGQPVEARDAIVGSIYVSRALLGDPAPRAVRVTIEPSPRLVAQNKE